MTDEIFNEYLQVIPKEHPILFSEPSLHNKENRLKLTELMFEKYGIPAMFICKSAVLSAFSCGRTTCLIFDSGHNASYSVPVHDGYTLQKSLIKHEIAGKWVTNELQKSIENKGIEIVPSYKFKKTKVDDMFQTEYLKGIKDDPSFENFHKKEIIRDVKETYLQLADDLVTNRYF